MASRRKSSRTALAEKLVKPGERRLRRGRMPHRADSSPRQQGHGLPNADLRPSGVDSIHGASRQRRYSKNDLIRDVTADWGRTLRYLLIFIVTTVVPALTAWLLLRGR